MCNSGLSKDADSSARLLEAPCFYGGPAEHLASRLSRRQEDLNIFR